MHATASSLLRRQLQIEKARHVDPAGARQQKRAGTLLHAPAAIQHGIPAMAVQVAMELRNAHLRARGSGILLHKGLIHNGAFQSSLNSTIAVECPDIGDP